MNKQTVYEQKLRSPDKVANLVKSGMWVDYGFGNSQPFLFDRVLAERVDELKRAR